LSDRLLTTPEAAKRLAVSESGLRKLVARGVVPAIKLGGRMVRFSESDLAAVIELSRQIGGGTS